MRRLLNVVVSLVILFGLVFGTVELVRLANGDFAGDYKLNGTFPRAGEGLHPGSAVVFRGVQVGRVSTISLYQNQAQVTLLIDPSFKVPTTSTATPTWCPGRPSPTPRAATNWGTSSPRPRRC
jgi:ABC-type transporter Mla subunit MlaD